MENAISIAGHIETTLRNNQAIRETLANNLPTTTMHHTTPQSYAYTFINTTMSKHAFLAALTQATSQHDHLHDFLSKHFYYTTNLNSTTPSTLKHHTTVTVLNLLLRVLAHPTSPNHAPEIPLTDLDTTTLAITKAITPCNCTKHSTSPSPIHHNIILCDTCNRLNPNNTQHHIAPLRYPKCMSCNNNHQMLHETPHPCHPCILLALLSQRKTSNWWATYTNP